MRAAAPAPAAAGLRIEVPPLMVETIIVRVVGDSPLICHRWSDKARRQMLEKQMKKATSGREAKDPQKDYEESLYHHPDGGYGFPSIAFKAAAVDACTQIPGITKVLARGAFHIPGELVKINGEPTMREDMVRIAMGTADIRYRAEFTTWSADIPISYKTDVLSAAQIINLLNTAGFAVGVGEWRPAKDGQYGRFHVATESDMGDLQ